MIVPYLGRNGNPLFVSHCILRAAFLKTFLTAWVLVATAMLGYAQESSPETTGAALIESFNTGMAALKANQYEAAIAALSRASKLGPTQVAVWANLADAYQKFAATRSGNEQRDLLEKAGETARTATVLNPNDAGMLNNYALILGQLGHLSEARAAIEKVVLLDPANSGTYYYNLGALLYNKDDDRGAVDALKKVPGNSAYSGKAVPLIERIRSENPFDKSTAYLSTPVFASVLSRYLDSANTGFVSLRGANTFESAEIKMWKSMVQLPGATVCGIVDTGQVQMGCRMTTARNAALLDGEYKELVTVLTRLLPDFKSMDLPSADGLASVTFRKSGGISEVWVTQSRDKDLTVLAVSVISYAKPIAPK